MSEEVVKVGVAAETSRTSIEETHEGLIPLLGLVVDLGNPQQVAEVLVLVRNAKRDLDTARAALERVLVEEGERVGSKTLRLGALEVAITGGPGSDIQWDTEELEKLLEAGLPTERYADLVTEIVSYKVDGRVARQIEGANPQYAEIVGRARVRADRPWRVSTK